MCGIRLGTDSVEEAREIFLSPSLASLRLQSKNHLCSLIMKSRSQENVVLGQVWLGLGGKLCRERLLAVLESDEDIQI